MNNSEPILAPLSWLYNYFSHEEFAKCCEFYNKDIKTPLSIFIRPLLIINCCFGLYMLTYGCYKRRYGGFSILASSIILITMRIYTSKFLYDFFAAITKSSTTDKNLLFYIPLNVVFWLVSLVSIFFLTLSGVISSKNDPTGRFAISCYLELLFLAEYYRYFFDFKFSFLSSTIIFLAWFLIKIPIYIFFEKCKIYVFKVIMIVTGCIHLFLGIDTALNSKFHYSLSFFKDFESYMTFKNLFYRLLFYFINILMLSIHGIVGYYIDKKNKSKKNN